jgi:hypothetical protein
MSGRPGVNSLRNEMEKLDLIRNLLLPSDLFAGTLPSELELYRQRVAIETPWKCAGTPRRHV